MSIERRLSQAEKAAAPHGDDGPRGGIIIFADDGEIVERYGPSGEDLRNTPLPDHIAAWPGCRTHINLDDDRRSSSRDDDDESNRAVFILLPEKIPILE